MLFETSWIIRQLFLFVLDYSAENWPYLSINYHFYEMGSCWRWSYSYWANQLLYLDSASKYCDLALVYSTPADFPWNHQSFSSLFTWYPFIFNECLPVEHGLLMHCPLLWLKIVNLGANCSAKLCELRLPKWRQVLVLVWHCLLVWTPP